MIAKRYQSQKSNSYYIEFTLFVRIGENGKAFMFGKYKDCSYWFNIVERQMIYGFNVVPISTLTGYFVWKFWEASSHLFGSVNSQE